MQLIARDELTMNEIAGKKYLLVDSDSDGAVYLDTAEDAVGLIGFDDPEIISAILTLLNGTQKTAGVKTLSFSMTDFAITIRKL